MRTMKWILLVIVLMVQLTLPTGAQENIKGVLMIPAIHLIEPVSESVLDHDGQYVMPESGVVHLDGTAWLEHDWARIALAGHTPGDFERVRDLAAGDLIVLMDRERVEWYRVVFSALVAADDTSWLFPTETETLILITCEGDLRRIVQAERIR